MHIFVCSSSTYRWVLFVKSVSVDWKKAVSLMHIYKLQAHLNIFFLKIDNHGGRKVIM